MQAKKTLKKINLKHFEFYLAEVTLHTAPPTAPEGFTHMGLAMCEIIGD